MPSYKHNDTMRGEARKLKEQSSDTIHKRRESEPEVGSDGGERGRDENWRMGVTTLQ